MYTPDRILVTGGAGFIGSHSCVYFDEMGAEVTALDNLSRRETLNTDDSRDTAKYNWEYLEEEHPSVNLVEMDIRNRDRLNEIVEGHDAVIHTAGQVAVTTSLKDPRTDFEVNAEGTFNVLEAARKADSDPTIVFASTNKVYGDNVNEIPVREELTRYDYDDPKFNSGIPESLSIDDTEHTPYGVSKLSADLYVQDYAARGVIDAAAFRMSCIYGPRQFGNGDQGWVAHFAISTLENEPLTIFGDGKQVRDVLHVNDLVRAYHAFIADPQDQPTVFNVGGGPENTVSLLELLNFLESKTNKRTEVAFDDWREGDQRVYVSDIKRARTHLDWTPEIDFETGIKQFVEWYLERDS